MSWPEIPEEPERIPQRPIMVTLAAVVVAIGISVAVVLGAFTHDHHASSQTIREVDLQPPARPFADLQAHVRSDMGSEHNFYNQSLPTSKLYKLWSDPDLDRWNWADRAAHRVRMPVDVAIDHYLARGGR